MARIGVARLSLAVPRPALAGIARWRAEEALRCAGEDGGSNLVLIRRLSLGVLPAGRGGIGQSAWTARAETQLRATVAGAVHALAPGTASAEAVFFNGETEARSALAMLLASGRRPSGWFWRLAVPEWTGGTWPSLAPALLPTLVALPGGAPALARLVVRALAGGYGTVLLAPIDHGLARSLGVASGLHESRVAPLVVVPASSDRPPQPAHGEPVAAAQPGLSVVVPDVMSGRQENIEQPPDGGTTMLAARFAAGRALAALPRPAVATLLVELQRHPPGSAAAVWLGAQVALAEAPHLAASPALLAEVAVAVTRLAMAGSRGNVTPAEPPATGKRPENPEPPPAEPGDNRKNDGDATASPPPPRPVQPLDPSAHNDEVDASWPMERRSEAAGLFLLIRPMALIGLPEWLDLRPDAAAGGFVWALLRSIAARMRVPPKDPIWATLAPGEAAPEVLTAWRVGLDVWLRRRARISLAATVRKPGWLIADPERIVLRFAVEAADIRLRRLALDVDPGWTPWLGRGVWFVYRDLPLLSDGGHQ